MNYTFLYLDPGSGSYLLQAIIAAVLGGLVFFKNFWTKVKSFFVRPKPESSVQEDELEESEQQNDSVHNP
ncbi:MAG: hypothetical protein ABIN94_04610 [Ferruginibacter sp.]